MPRRAYDWSIARVLCPVVPGMPYAVLRQLALDSKTVVCCTHDEFNPCLALAQGAIDAMKAATALVARMALAPDVPRAELLGDADPVEVAALTEAIAAGLLRAISPGDDGAEVLERLGLVIAGMEECAGDGI